MPKEAIEATRREKLIQKSIVVKDIIIVMAGITVVGEIKLGSRIIKRIKTDIKITVSSVEIIVDVFDDWRICFDSIEDIISCSITIIAIDFVNITAAAAFD